MNFCSWNTEKAKGERGHIAEEIELVLCAEFWSKKNAMNLTEQLYQVNLPVDRVSEKKRQRNDYRWMMKFIERQVDTFNPVDRIKWFRVPF